LTGKNYKNAKKVILERQKTDFNHFLKQNMGANAKKIFFYFAHTI